MAAAADGIRVICWSTVCNSDIGAPLDSSGATRSKNAAVSGAQETVDADRDQRAGDKRDEIHVGGLTAGVERRKQHPAREAAQDRPPGDFRHDVDTPFPAAMPICKVALAVGTSRHGLG